MLFMQMHINLVVIFRFLIYVVINSIQEICKIEILLLQGEMDSNMQKNSKT